MLSSFVFTRSLVEYTTLGIVFKVFGFVYVQASSLTTAVAATQYSLKPKIKLKCEKEKKTEEICEMFICIWCLE